MRKLSTFIALSLVFISISTLRAQTLADRVPGDSFVYLGWKGSETPDTGYQGSHLQAILGASNFKAMFDDVLPQVIDLATKQDATAKENIQVAMSIAAPMFKHPTAIFVRPGAQPNVPVRAGMICQAGADAKALAQQITDAIAKAPETKPYIRVSQAEDFVTVLIGYSDTDAGAKVEPNAALISSAAFAAASKTAGAKSDSFVTLYLDIDGGTGLITQGLQQHDKHGLDEWNKLRAATGLAGLHHFFASANFEGKDWTTSMFVDAPAPRSGFIKIFEGRPLDADAMKLIPASAASALMARFDLAALANEVRNIMDVMDPADGAANFDHAMDMAQQFTGLNPITDVLQPLGDTWAVFSDEKIAGTETTGLIFINQLRDPAVAEKSLTTLWAFGGNMLNGPMGAAAHGQVAMGDETIEEIPVHTLTMPQMKIGWSVQKGKLIVAMKADAVASVAKNPPATSFDQNMKFAEMSKKLSGGAPINSFRFTDLTATAPAVYQQLEQGWMMARMFGGMQGINLPEAILPPLDVIKANVSPATEVSWIDATGFHSRSLSPFPGSDFLSNLPNGQLTSVGGAALGVSILLPSLNRARETANRIKCASNERQIGQAILLYSNDHKGAYPPDLGTLLLTEDLTPDVFICPSGNTALPGADTTTPQQLADWVNQHGDYVYAGQGLNNNTAPADRVIVYEKSEDHDNDGMNMLYGDGHVEFQLMPEAKKLIEETKGK